MIRQRETHTGLGIDPRPAARSNAASVFARVRRGAFEVLALLLALPLALSAEEPADPAPVNDVAAAPPAAASSGPRLEENDPGIRLEIDRDAYRVQAVDLAAGEIGPSVRVAIGSPDFATPPGRYRLWQVVRDPAWSPGPTARELGADSSPPSPDGPMGIAKIPFSGAYALHGGANRFSVGKPVTLGCLRSVDAELGRLLSWLEAKDALGEIRTASNGERPQSFVRPIHLVIR